MVNDPVNSTGNLPALPDDPGQFILYQTEDGQTRVEVRFFQETVWLSQKAMAELFQKDVRTISEHLRNVFSEGELSEPAVIRKFRITASDGKQYDTLHYNLDVIISVGYRVKSHRGTQFRIWATQRLREYLIKGFALDDQRLKQAGGGNYFDELLARIRDIRSSEKVFWRKVLDLYATSIDYDPNTDLSHQFFATVQNKMHWAALQFGQGEPKESWRNEGLSLMLLQVFERRIVKCVGLTLLPWANGRVALRVSMRHASGDAQWRFRRLVRSC